MKKASWFSKEYAFILVFCLFMAAAKLFQVRGVDPLYANFVDFSLEIFTLVPCIFLLIGLFDAWVPRETIEKHTGECSGVKGAALVILLAMFQGGPLYGAFPVAHILWEKGCSPRNVFMYIGAFSTLKIPMLAFEISFIGLEFALLRAVVALPVFLIIAEVMARYVRRKSCEVPVLTKV